MLLQSAIKPDDFLLFLSFGTIIFFVLLAITIAYTVGSSKRNRLLNAQILLLAEIAINSGVSKERVVNILHKTKDSDLSKIK